MLRKRNVWQFSLFIAPGTRCRITLLEPKIHCLNVIRRFPPDFSACGKSSTRSACDAASRGSCWFTNTVCRTCCCSNWAPRFSNCELIYPTLSAVRLTKSLSLLQTGRWTKPRRRRHWRSKTAVNGGKFWLFHLNSFEQSTTITFVDFGSSRRCRSRLVGGRLGG